MFAELLVLVKKYGLDKQQVEEVSKFLPVISPENWGRYTEQQKDKLRVGFEALFSQLNKGGSQ